MTAGITRVVWTEATCGCRNGTREKLDKETNGLLDRVAAHYHT
jgi:hypothetical protein